MKNRPLPTFALLTLFAFSPGMARGAVIFDEGISGDLSGTFGAPTPVVFSAGPNTVIGQVGNNGNTGATNGQDADYFTFSVPAGASISSITIDLYTFAPSDPGVSFMGTVAASSFAGQAAGNVDNFVLFNAGSGNVISGLGGSLGAGDHSFWIQETSPNTVNYQVTFTQVPEPAVGTLGGLVVGALSLRRRRR